MSAGSYVVGEWNRVREMGKPPVGRFVLVKVAGGLYDVLAWNGVYWIGQDDVRRSVMVQKWMVFERDFEDEESGEEEI